MTESVEGEVEDTVLSNRDGEAVLGHWGRWHDGEVALGDMARARWQSGEAAPAPARWWQDEAGWRMGSG